MKASLTPPDTTEKNTRHDRSSGASIIDTTKMSAGQRAALELAESSRDSRELSGFAASLFDGSPDFRTLFPFPAQSESDRAEGDAFLQKLGTFLRERTDPDAIDREGEIPDEVFKGLATLGAFGIKIPKDLGGLGLSQTNYSRAAMLLGGHCGNLTALLSAHQSIGIPQPLLVFGTDEQKRKYLPQCAAGDVSAFALTENEVGSDPARMKTTAKLSEDGSHWILDGEKLWCTNGLKAKHLIVMARTPLPDKPHAITAFIVETAWPGVEIVTRCRFMGLKALYNGVIRFTGVKIPRENVVAGEGKGLKVALTTLNTGRLTLPAACVGLLRRCLDIALTWSREREQWGQIIGKHEAIAGKLADLAADAFATEAMVRYTSALVDADKHADIRIEAAIAKLWGTEAGWHGADSTMQIKGGRGYETADSLRARGDKPDPVERLLRDCRINTIFEGSTEIMHLFIAREALDPHLRRGAAALDTRKATGERLSAAMRAGVFYAGWYPKRWLPSLPAMPDDLDPGLKRGLRDVARLSRRLARTLFHAMARNGPKLERRQLLLGRLVDVGSELFAMSSAAAYAHSQGDEVSIQTARYVCQRGKRRIEALFADASRSPDKSAYRLAKTKLESS
jgi:alkylation response protein AidB-like acyl-CoA dehydrogenase